MGIGDKDRGRIKDRSRRLRTALLVNFFIYIVLTTYFYYYSDGNINIICKLWTLKHCLFLLFWWRLVLSLRWL
jgi:hypothetical protein